MSKQRCRTAVAMVAVAAVAAVLAAAPAQANPIRFDNPAHGQPGHYDWAAALDVTTHYLVITLPAESQADLPEPGVPGGFIHRYSLADNLSSCSAGTTGSFQKGGVSTSSVAAFDFGGTIPSAPFTWGSSGRFIHPTTGTNFPEGVEKYIGVKFNPGDGDHYGWIGVVRTGLILDAFAWGYETQAGVPIAAGVPEPGTLALLALGAVGVIRRRR